MGCHFLTLLLLAIKPKGSLRPALDCPGLPCSDDTRPCLLAGNITIHPSDWADAGLFTATLNRSVSIAPAPSLLQVTLPDFKQIRFLRSLAMACGGLFRRPLGTASPLSVCALHDVPNLLRLPPLPVALLAVGDSFPQRCMHCASFKQLQGS